MLKNKFPHYRFKWPSFPWCTLTGAAQISLGVCETVSFSRAESLWRHQALRSKKALRSMEQTDRLLPRGLKDQQLLWKLDPSSDGPAQTISSLLYKHYSEVLCRIRKAAENTQVCINPLNCIIEEETLTDSAHRSHQRLACWRLHHWWDDTLNFVLLSLKWELWGWQTQDGQPGLLMRFTFRHCC